MKNVDVVALGDLILNMVYRGKTEAGFNLYERQPAGATGNLLSQIVRLGGTGALITTVGDDDHGKFLYEYAKESGIDVSGVVISDKVETRMMFVHFDEKNDRHFLKYESRRTDVETGVDAVDFDRIRSSRAFVIPMWFYKKEKPIYAACQKIIEVVREQNGLLGLDCNWRGNTHTQEEMTSICDAALTSDIVKLTDVELEHFFGEKDILKGSERLVREKNKLVAVTLGEDGCLLRNRNGYVYQPTYAVDVVDTTGAGDSFMGALLFQATRKGFSYNTINNHKRSLKASFYIAIQDDCVRKNPFDFKLSEVIENDTKEKVALTEEQEQALLSFIKTDNVYHKYYDDVLILLKTGLRISELCGLTVADIDFKNEVVIIDHQLLKSKEQGYYIETPKTKSGARQVPLSKGTIQAFQRVMKKRPKAEPFVIDGRGNFLFVNQKGKPKVAIDYNMLFVRLVKKYNKHHKDNPLPHITPHTLRHTFCTRLASKNMNPKDLQYIMGHSNISITMNWYAHASIDTAKSEVQRLIA